MSTAFPRQIPRIVLFDMDGTAVRHVDERVINFVEWLDDRTYFLTSILPRLFQGKVNFDEISADSYLDARAQKKKPRLIGHKALHRLRRKGVDQIVQPSPYVELVLDSLKDHGILMGLASNGLGKGYGHDVLDTFGLSEYFQATVFREDIRKSKPDPESLLLTLQQIGIDLDADDVVWYIGDRHKDVKAAVAANKVLDCTVVPIAYTLNAAVQIIKEDYSPDHVMMDYRDIHQRLVEVIQDS